MRVFQVRQIATGVIIWTGLAQDELGALDAMAHQAGYYDHSDIPENINRGGLSVEALKFDAPGSRVPRAGERVTGGRRFSQNAERSESSQSHSISKQGATTA